MTNNQTELSQKIARLIIKEIDTQTSSNTAVIKHVVNNTDLESEFLSALIGDLVKRIRYMESVYPQFKG